MTKIKRTEFLTKEEVILASTYCPHCEKEHRFIWYPEHSEKYMQCRGCSKGFIVEDKS